jgi:alanyl-tRNA synthetase
MVIGWNRSVAKGVHAGNVVKVAAPVFGGGGGGKPYFAQGGGTQPDKLPDAVKAAEEAIKKQLNA